MPEETNVAPEVSSSSGFDRMAADLDSMDTADPETEAAVEEASPSETPDPEPAPADENTEVEEQPEEEEPALFAEKQEKKDEAQPAEELPEGVRLEEKNGRKEYHLKESRYRLFHDAHKVVREVEPIFGEALTREAAQARQNAYVGQGMMIGDFLSGDPQSEARFLNELARWGKAAREMGEIRHNPLQNIVTQLPKVLQEIGDTETLDKLTTPLLESKLKELYGVAFQENNENLKHAIQHVEQGLFKKYSKLNEVMPPDPMAKREAELAAREARLQETDRQRAQRELAQWERDSTTAITGAVDEEISNALKPVQDAYAKFPREFQGLKELLYKNFQNSLKTDQAWQEYLRQQTRRAANAESPEVRQAIAEDLANRYRAKARYALDPNRNADVKEILSQRAAAMKAQSEANLKRLQAGAARREPGSGGTPVPQQVRNGPNGKTGADAWADAVETLFK